MFCTSLRKRRDWRPALAILSQSVGGAPTWRESTLETHDVAFEVDEAGKKQSVFRAILVSPLEPDLSTICERMERLSLLNGGRLIAAIMLLSGDGAMTAFTKLQAELLERAIAVPILPVSSAAELVPCLNRLRQQMEDGQNKQKEPVGGTRPSPRDVLANCTDDTPLSWRQTNVLMDMLPGFKDLALGSFNADNKVPMNDYLGKDDGSRVMAFFTSGPKPAHG